MISKTRLFSISTWFDLKLSTLNLTTLSIGPNFRNFYKRFFFSFFFDKLQFAFEHFFFVWLRPTLFGLTLAWAAIPSFVSVVTCRLFSCLSFSFISISQPDSVTQAWFEFYSVTLINGDWTPAHTSTGKYDGDCVHNRNRLAWPTLHPSWPERLHERSR